MHLSCLLSLLSLSETRQLWRTNTPWRWVSNGRSPHRKPQTWTRRGGEEHAGSRRYLAEQYSWSWRKDWGWWRHAVHSHVHFFNMLVELSLRGKPSITLDAAMRLNTRWRPQLKYKNTTQIDLLIRFNEFTRNKHSLVYCFVLYCLLVHRDLACVVALRSQCAWWRHHRRTRLLLMALRHCHSWCHKLKQSFSPHLVLWYLYESCSMLTFGSAGSRGGSSHSWWSGWTWEMGIGEMEFFQDEIIIFVYDNA